MSADAYFEAQTAWQIYKLITGYKDTEDLAREANARMVLDYHEISQKYKKLIDEYNNLVNKYNDLLGLFREEEKARRRAEMLAKGTEHKLEVYSLTLKEADQELRRIREKYGIETKYVSYCDMAMIRVNPKRRKEIEAWQARSIPTREHTIFDDLDYAKAFNDGFFTPPKVLEEMDLATRILRGEKVDI